MYKTQYTFGCCTQRRMFTINYVHSIHVLFAVHEPRCLKLRFDITFGYKTLPKGIKKKKTALKYLQKI